MEIPAGKPSAGLTTPGAAKSVPPKDLSPILPARTFQEWVATIFSALIVAVAILIYVRVNITRPITWLGDPSDFSAYFHAAQDTLHGKSPYNDPVFFYPPLLAFLMIPLAGVDYVTARWIWFVLSHLLLIGAAGLLWRGMGGGRIALCCIACVWALGGAAKETLRQGQLTPLLVLILVVAYTQRGRLRGAFAGLGFALKYFPGIIALPLLLGRRWHALAASLGVVLAGLCVPWLVLAEFFRGAKMPVSATYWMGTPSMFSWSVPSLVLRLLIPIKRGAPFPADWEFGNVAATLHLGLRLEWTSVATALFVFASGMIVLTVVCRGHLSDNQIPWAMAGLVSLSLAIAPVSWSHYQLLQYPGVAMLLTTALRRRYWLLAFASAVCFALVYQLPQYFLITYYEVQNAWTTTSPSTLYFWTSVPPLATVAIFGLAIAMVRRDISMHSS